MSAKKTQLEALTPRQVTMVFEEIASTALALDGLLGILETGAVIDDCDRGPVTTAAVLLNQRMGLLAELYGERCGERRPILVKGVDGWLMPRSFADSLSPREVTVAPDA